MEAHLYECSVSNIQGQNIQLQMLGDIIRETISVIGILLHGVGLYLIASIGPGVMNKNQRIFLANLSAAELVLLTTEVSKFVIEKSHSQFAVINIYILAAEVNGIVIYYYMVMIYFTLNRFFEVYLNIKHAIICTSSRCWILCGATIMVCLIGALVAVIVWHIKRVDYRPYIVEFVFPTIDVSFVVVATFTYVYLFVEFRRHAVPAYIVPEQRNQQANLTPAIIPDTQADITRTPVHRKLESPMTVPGDQAGNGIAHKAFKRKKNTSFKLYKHSNFVMVTLIIVSFVVFALIPDLVSAALIRDVSNPALPYMQMMFMVGFVFDAVTYIFVHNGMRRALMRKLGSLKRTREQATGSPVISSSVV